MKSNSRTIKVECLARVEGEGGLLVRTREGKVTDVKLRIYEPPRFFEAFMRGRAWHEAPDITARICGICPVAYQMSACHAMENALGTRVTGGLRELRRLLYCGEWIESHALHVFMLHAPDFLGYEDAIRMAKDHPKVVEMGLRLKKCGNDIVNLLGGREIHPINVRVGGFYKIPARSRWDALVERLKQGRDEALAAVAWCKKLKFPKFEQDYEFVALRHESEYPMCEGRLVSNKGLDIPIGEFYDHVIEEHVEHSTALHSTIKGRGAYHVGPLARFNLNFDRLTPTAQEAAEQAGLVPGCRNPFMSIVVRMVEMLYAFEEALRILENYPESEEPAVTLQLRAGVGHGCTEAPRGILYHRYKLDEKGIIQDARIAPPTAQNLRVIEQDLREFVPKVIGHSHERLTWECEQAIRNYDPCISCSAHFLKVRIEQES
jgi:coenzyme F420-reducing hydrogenase alpha subunit